MAKVLKDAQLTTRTARERLPGGLHWRGIDPEVHLGYRKGKHGGVWLVRWRSGKGYRQASIGTADDEITEGTLDFHAAERSARETVAAARAAAAAAAVGPVPTVGSVVSEYVAERDARDSKRAGRKVRSDAGQRLGRYLLGQGARGRQAAIEPAQLAAMPLHQLREKDLRSWLVGLPATLKPTTRQRLVNDMKAALNAGYAANRDGLEPAVAAAIKLGLKTTRPADDAHTVARDNQVLADADVSRLVKAARELDAEQGWNGDLFRLVLVLAATGARFSQVARLQVRDCQVDRARLMMPVSRKGRGNRAGSIPVPVGQDVLDALAPVVDGRNPTAPLLERWRSEQRPGGIEWHRTDRGAWRNAAELARPWDDIQVRAGISVIPYALRHSSIVRGIRAGLPLQLVAKSHDTSTKMIESHYGAWITSSLEDLSRKAIVEFINTR